VTSFGAVRQAGEPHFDTAAGPFLPKTIAPPIEPDDVERVPAMSMPIVASDEFGPGVHRSRCKGSP